MLLRKMTGTLVKASCTYVRACTYRVLWTVVYTTVDCGYFSPWQKEEDKKEGKENHMSYHRSRMTVQIPR